MKCLERVVLNHLAKAIKPFLDPRQFAYKTNRSTDDASITLLYYVRQHCDKPGTSARLLVVDFPSMFNTIQPHLMTSKLRNMNVNPTLILWVLDFLTNRSQYVKINGASSSSRNMNTGKSQGSVISPALYCIALYCTVLYCTPCTVHPAHE